VSARPNRRSLPEGTIERWPPGPETGRAWVAIGGGEEIREGDLSFPAESLPALVGSSEKARYVILMALADEDLVAYGFSLQPELSGSPLGEAMLTELLAIARTTARAAVRIGITNADVAAFSFLQMKGFTIADVRALPEGGTRGYAGIVKSHLVTLRMEA